MDVAEIIGLAMNQESSALNMSLAKSCAQILGGDMSLLCECFTFKNIQNPELTDTLTDDTTPEFDLRTLGIYCKEMETSAMLDKMQWIQHVQKGKVFSRICKGEIITSQNNKTINFLPDGCLPINNFIGIPIFDISQVVIGIIVVGNIANTEFITHDEIKNKTKPIIDIIRLIMTHNLHRKLLNVVESVIDHIQIPLTVFQKRQNTDTFYCLMHNIAFSDQILKNKLQSIVGGSLNQCFPQLQHTQILIQPLLNLFTNKNSSNKICVEAIEYEDMLVVKDNYTIKFSRVDDCTFVFSIENISDQLKAKMLAEETAQAKEQFVANVSHEIRTPLNGILGYIAMMSDPKEVELLTEYQKNCFSQIKDCSMNLLYVMNDILDFSKLNADQMQLKEEPFELTDLLEKSYDVILPSAHEKGLEGAFLIDPNVPPRLKGDFKKVRQILLNLLSNGIKFTPRGRVDTTVKLVKDNVTGEDIDVRGRHTIEFCVQDTGIGISKKDQSKLFKPFSQIDQSNKKIYQGTGLGLIISRKLVEMMGGKIWMESNVGDGSQFYFTIKLEEARTTSPEIQIKYLPMLKDRCVLIVDDHATNRITISSYLLRWGMKPVVCGSAEEALLYLRGSVMQFDMALIDMRMPKMDGNELAGKISALNPTLPLVAISSLPLGPKGTKEINKLFCFYLSKPIRHRQLFNVCLAVIKKANESSTKKSLTSPLPQVHDKRQPKKSMTNLDYLQEKQERPQEKKSLTKREPDVSTKNFAFTTLIPCIKLSRSFLIAEDLITNQRVVIGFLEKLGFSDFTVAEDGSASYEAVKKRHFDIILMDLKMPVMDGFEATHIIRKFYKKNRRNEKPPFIIALTANAMGGIRERCADADMNGYLTKPIDMNELAHILNDAA